MNEVIEHELGLIAGNLTSIASSAFESSVSKGFKLFSSLDCDQIPEFIGERDLLVNIGLIKAIRRGQVQGSVLMMVDGSEFDVKETLDEIRI